MNVGLAEHASVAAFARLVLHLMSLGAPPALLQDAARAMSDEIEHARLCFGLARKLNGVAASPGKMDIARALEQPHDPPSILRAAIIEGCVEETVSARCAQAGLERAKDAAVIAALTRIVDDESRHADLSWRLVEWMLKTFPELHPTADEAFTWALAAQDAEENEEESPLFEDYGVLMGSSRRAVREETVRNEITTRMVALLGRHPAVSAIAASAPV